MSATCVRAESLRDKPEGEKAMRLADAFCRQSRLRIEDLFNRLFDNADNSTYRIAQEVLRGEHEWLAEGIVNPVQGDTTLLGGDDQAEARTTDRDLSDTSIATQVGAGG